MAFAGKNAPNENGLLMRVESVSWLTGVKSYFATYYKFSAGGSLSPGAGCQPSKRLALSNSTSSSQSDTGSIADTSVVEVLARLESSSCNARIWFETEAGMGEVLLYQGLIVQARLGGARGRTALLRILSACEGTFGVEPCLVAGGTALIPSVRDLIELRQARQVQWQELCSHAPPLGSVLKLSPVGANVRDSSRGIQRVIFVLIDGRRTLMQILEESSFDPVDGLTIVIKAIDDGLVLHAPQASTLFPLAVNGDASGVMPRFATPPPLPRLDPTAPTPFGDPASWRHATLVGLGKHSSSADRVSESLAPSPIIDLGHRTAIASQRESSPMSDLPSRTKTITHGFVMGELPDSGLASYPIPNQPPDGSSTSAEAFESNGIVAAGNDYNVSENPERQGQSAPSGLADEPTKADAGPPSEQFQAAPAVTKLEGTRRYVDRYEVLLRIGRGGMGTVYLCRLSSAGVGFRRLFALKLLRSHLSRDTQAAKDFIEEARVAGYLHHPNVVAVSDAGFHGKQPYLVMDYVEGCSLKQLMSACPKRSPYYLLRIVIDALAGLHAAHILQDDAGADFRLVHCDVSPENLLIGVNGTCRLTDFGVARKANRSLGSTTRGKPGYVSPEQVSGQSFDHRSDIFSVGVVLWNSLTGQKLFAGESVEETLAQVCAKPILAPSAVGAESYPALDRLVLRALARNPEERFESAEHMLSSLREVTSGYGGLATTTEIAAWVREAAGSELAQRRLAILDASRNPTVPPLRLSEITRSQNFPR